jgi:hypothetical protein
MSEKFQTFCGIPQVDEAILKIPSPLLSSGIATDSIFKPDVPTDT